MPWKSSFVLKAGASCNSVQKREDTWISDEGELSHRWNYTEEGINDGCRVLEVIGKKIDDVVFVSDEVRSTIIRDEKYFDQYDLIHLLHNRGRRKDKHKKMRRVYQLQHTELLPHPECLSE